MLLLSPHADACQGTRLADAGTARRTGVVHVTATLLDTPTSSNAALWLAPDLDDDRLDQKVNGSIPAGQLKLLGITDRKA